MYKLIYKKKKKKKRECWPRKFKFITHESQLQHTYRYYMSSYPNYKADAIRRKKKADAVEFWKRKEKRIGKWGSATSASRRPMRIFHKACSIFSSSTTSTSMDFGLKHIGTIIPSSPQFFYRYHWTMHILLYIGYFW